MATLSTTVRQQLWRGIMRYWSRQLAATAFTYLPHNASSRFQGYGWVGLVAVAPAHRGRALGTYINACAVTAAFAQLGATHVYEQVSATNTPSRRMVESSGLTLHPVMKAGLAVRGTEKFTR